MKPMLIDFSAKDLERILSKIKDAKKRAVLSRRCRGYKKFTGVGGVPSDSFGALLAMKAVTLKYGANNVHVVAVLKSCQIYGIGKREKAGARG